MKPIFCSAHRMTPLAGRAALVLAAVALVSTAARGQLVPKSPVGPTWDCLLGGARNGVAYITFADDGTFSGYQVLVPTPPPAPRPALVSVAGGGNGLGLQPGTPAITNRTEIFGACPVSGTWGFDSKGRIQGSFLEVVYSTACTTTAIPVSTNLFDSFDPTSTTNSFPMTFSFTVPLSTNKAAGLFKNQTVSYLDQVPVSTNVFDAPAPIYETNVLASGISITEPIGSSPYASAYSNQVSCYMPPVPLTTNTFTSPLPYAATNHLPSGAMCVTLPIHTNLDLVTFTEQMTRYQDHVALYSSTFTNPVALTVTNYLPDGTYCETVPVFQNSFRDTFVKTMTCYLGPLLLTTNIFESPIWIAESQTLSDGSVCTTLPIGTNMVAGSFTEELVAYNSSHTALSTNLFISGTRIDGTNRFPDDSYTITSPLATNFIASTFIEQSTCIPSAVPVSVSTFTSSNCLVTLDMNPDGAFCITKPVFTNLTLITFTEQTTCYTNHVPVGTPSLFVSSTAFTATNYLPDGTYYETVVASTNAFAGAFTEQMVCYLEPVLINSYTYLDTAPASQTVVYPDGTYCVTQPVGTNTVGGMYKMQTVWYITQTDCASVLTNTVNFIGTVAPAKRLTLLGKSTMGAATYRGVPAVALQDISGSWRGMKQQNQVPAYEFFNLTDSPYAPNSYVVSGNGAGYTFKGLALLSSRKQIALACEVLVGTDYQGTRAVIGSYNVRKASANAHGLEAPSGMIGSTNRVSFQFSKRTTLP